MFDSGVMLWEEIRCWSLLGCKGLIFCITIWFIKHLIFQIKINLKKVRPLLSSLLNHKLIWSFLVQPIHDSFFRSNASSIFVAQTIIITKLQLFNTKLGLPSCVFLSPYTNCWIFRVCIWNWAILLIMVIGLGGVQFVMVMGLCGV